MNVVTTSGEHARGHLDAKNAWKSCLTSYMSVTNVMFKLAGSVDIIGSDKRFTWIATVIATTLINSVCYIRPCP